MLTQQDVKDIITYDPETGIVTAKVSRGNVKEGKILGTKHNSGYLSINLNEETHLLHRVIYLYVYGYFPELVDHKNMDKTDNRLENLREATKAQNIVNSKTRKDNILGLKGISPRTTGGIVDRYVAQVGIDGKRYKKEYRITVKRTAEEAITCCQEWITSLRQELHADFCNHG